MPSSSKFSFHSHALHCACVDVKIPASETETSMAGHHCQWDLGSLVATHYDR